MFVQWDRFAFLLLTTCFRMSLGDSSPTERFPRFVYDGPFPEPQVAITEFRVGSGADSSSTLTTTAPLTIKVVVEYPYLGKASDRHDRIRKLCDLFSVCMISMAVLACLGHMITGNGKGNAEKYFTKVPPSWGPENANGGSFIGFL